MSIWQGIKDLFKRGGQAMGVNSGLNKVTDDSRVNLPESEILRIERAKQYYKDDLQPYELINSFGHTIKRDVRSINITKMASRKLASIIFNERCSVTVDNEQAQALLDQIFKDADFYLTFEDYLEKWIALGSGCIRPYVENDKIKLSWATADQVFPLTVNTNEVKDIAIAFKTSKIENHMNVYYTLLEFHSWTKEGLYQITNELYRSVEDSNRVGDRVPLSMIEDYANLSETVTFSDSVKAPLFAFYKNPGANNKCLISPLGLGLIDNSKSIVDAINRTHSQFIWEIKEGQRRIIVPETFLGRENLEGNPLNARQFNKNQHPPMYDPDTTVYRTGYGLSEDQIQDMTQSIRVQEYSDTMSFFLHEFENATGLSQGTFTTSPSGVQTATEVVTNNSMTYQTRSSYLTQVEKTIKGLVKAILTLASTPSLFSNGQKLWKGDVDNVNCNIDFNDGVFVDQNAQQQQDLQAVTANIMPKLQFLMRSYNLNEDTARQWLDQVKAEQQPNDPDFEQFMAGGDDNGDTSENESSGEQTR